ncbi:MAG: cell division protein FtsZ [Solirubrobacterales bacterium]|nr:cell division protein FtsZ [Solirubrobacterales bacterium]
MAKRKRASMREGPLADLFRSTIDDGLSDRAVEPADTGSHPAQPPAPVERPAAPPPPPPAPAQPEPVEPMIADSSLIEEPAHGQIEVYRGNEAPSRADSLVAEIPGEPGPSEPEPEPEPAPPQEPPHSTREPKDRLRQFFGDEMSRSVSGDEPDPRRFGTAPKIHRATIRVIGVGGAGVNAVNRMIEAGVPGVEFMAINTDLQSLQRSSADVTVHIGVEATRGLGSGSDPDLGYRSAFAEQDKIKRLLKGSDMVFITAGAGGGTGTGAAPLVAKLARDIGALTVGIVTKPFAFEGSRRAEQAEAGIRELAGQVDTLIVVPNQKLISILERNTSMVEAFRVADDVLRQGVQGISDLVTLPGLINLDFADVRTIMSDGGRALLGIGMGIGENRAVEAATKAVSSPLLEVSMDGARSLLLSITGGRDLSLIEVSEAAKVIQEHAHPEANIIFGANIDDELNEQVWVTVVATRFDGGKARRGTLAEPVRDTRSTRSSGPSKAREVTTGELGVDVPEFLDWQ